MSRQDEVETSVERADPLVGTIFDKRFRVEERIAAGGFGAIYRATHVKSGHPIALKVLLPSLARDLGVVARFRREGDTLTALRCPHTITAYELGQAADRTLFITMELLYGESLFERYKANGPFEWKRMVKIASEVCESLEEAHAMGIVHRDLKPTNIHLEKHGDDPDYVKVLDFGIAKILRGSDFDAGDITNAGQMIGTLDYMSPEQMVGGTVTGQSDIYTLGIVMYEMIAGTTPFPEALTASQALAAVMKTKPEPLYLRAPVPEELDRIVMRCLERDTSRRYQTVGELRADLVRLLAGDVPGRAAAIETVPIEKHDDEATTVTPPPEMMPRRAKRPSAEATTFTPPPEPLLAQTRRPEWSTSESTALVSPSQQLLAQARRPKRPSAESTAFTPPPVQLLDELRSAPPEWGDDDESIATAKRPRPSVSDEHDRETAVARLADIVERAAMTRRPAGERTVTVPRGEPSERAVTVPRGRPSELEVTHPRGAPVASPAPARKPTTAPPPLTSSEARPGSAPVPPAAPEPPRPATPAQPVPLVPRTMTPSSVSPPGPAISRAPTPSSIPPPATALQGPVPPLAAAPFSSRPPGLPLQGPEILDLSSYPVVAQSPPKSSFDMGRIAAREAMIRRAIWVVVLILAVGVGAILATQL